MDTAKQFPSDFLDRFYWQFSTEFGRLIATLLVDEPSEWKIDRGGCRLEHASRDISIWIANKSYALRVEVRREVRGDEITPPWADRKLIYRQVKRMRLPSPEAVKRRRALNALTSNAADGQP